MEIKVKLDSSDCMPAKANKTDAGYDLKAITIKKAYINDTQVENPKFNNGFQINPFSRVLVGTGVRIELPKGYYAEVVSRSGMTLKYGLIVLNSPGIIDSDYRGEIGVILYNSTNQYQYIYKFDRIAQLIIHKLDESSLISSDILTETDRGEGGFGSTGK